jgi:hypothetical protein
LHGECAHASSGADDEDSLLGLDLSMITDGLECRIARDRDRRGLLEREVCRLPCEPGRSSARVFGEGAVGGAEHLISRTERAHVLADRLNASSEVITADGVLGCA